MKVFELMAELSKMPAGAEVEFSAMMTIPEFVKEGAEVCDEGDMYHIQAKIAEVEKCEYGNKVFLYQ